MDIPRVYTEGSSFRFYKTEVTAYDVRKRSLS